MRPVLPRPGTLLGNDCDLIVVVAQGWTDGQIRAAIARWADQVEDLDPLTCEYALDRWYYHTKDQADDTPGDYDNYWSPEGRGASAVDVAVVE